MVLFSELLPVLFRSCVVMIDDAHHQTKKFQDQRDANPLQQHELNKNMKTTLHTNRRLTTVEDVRLGRTMRNFRRRSAHDPTELFEVLLCEAAETDSIDHQLHSRLLRVTRRIRLPPVQAVCHFVDAHLRRPRHEKRNGRSERPRSDLEMILAVVSFQRQDTARTDERCECVEEASDSDENKGDDRFDFDTRRDADETSEEKDESDDVGGEVELR